jgi:YidC/Oxa1 family membrane protein insertase
VDGAKVDGKEIAGIDQDEASEPEVLGQRQQPKKKKKKK